MSVDREYQAGQTTGSGQIHSGEAFVKGLWLLAGASEGTAVLRDGGSGGEVKASFDTPADSTVHYIPFPGRGVHFSDTVYAELTNVTAVTVFYRT